MNEEGTLANDIRSYKLEDARQRLMQGEKLSKNLSDFEKNQIYEVLVNNKAFDIINALVDDGIIETDIYEYEKLEGSLFAKLFTKLSDDSDDLVFFTDFLTKLDNINDAIQDHTLLGLAFINSAHIEMINLLVNAGCNINYKNNYEQNFLYQIIQEYNIKENTGLQYLEFLMQQGLDPNAGNIVGQTPLHLAIDKNKKQYIELLLQNGADPNQPDKNGETPFYIAVVHQVCKLETYNLIKQYALADFNIVNKEGETLFVGAVRMRRSGAENELQLLQALIADGADIYQTSTYYDNEKSALDWICEYPSDVLKAILDTGAIEINRKDDDGNSLLHKVCAYDVNYDQELAKQLYRKVKLLIEHGADVNMVNDLEQTPIDLAASDNLKDKTVELLLKYKA